MFLKYYLSSYGTPLLSPFLYYTLAANMKSHNGKNMNPYYLAVLFLSTFESPV